MIHKSTSAALGVLLLSGCMNLAPKTVTPALPTDAAFPSARTTDTQAQRPAWDIGWDEYFTDPKLRQIIGMAIENNRDLRVAMLNVDRARALYQVQGGALYPTIGAGIGGTRQRALTSIQGTPVVGIGSMYQATVGITSWEIDFFGRIRNLKDAAVQQFFASQEAVRSAQIGLVASVANAYLALAADREQLSLAQQTLKSQQTSYDLIRRTVELGAGSALDQYQVETAVQTARGDAARFQGQVQKDRDALTLLVGRAIPDDLLPENTVPMMNASRALPAGIPSDVLVRRPDVISAERQLAAANANIGAARAQMLPSITLTGTGGLASFQLDNLFSDPARIWSFGPSLRLPLFTGGSLRANLEASKYSRDIAVAQYEKTVQSAFAEVSDALADRATIDERIAAQNALVKAAAASYDLSQARFKNGADSYLNALISQRTLYGAQQQQIALRQTYGATLITLYKVLGGGWKQGSEATLQSMDETNPPTMRAPDATPAQSVPQDADNVERHGTPATRRAKGRARVPSSSSGPGAPGSSSEADAMPTRGAMPTPATPASQR